MSGEEEDFICSLCKCRKNANLVLECNHNLCLSCAAENLLRQQLSGIKKFQNVVCDLCGKKTEIDSETFEEILNSKLNEDSQNQNYNPNYNNINISNSNQFPINNINKSIPNDNVLIGDLGLSNNNSNPVNFVYFNTSQNPISSSLGLNLGLGGVQSNNLFVDSGIHSNGSVCTEHGEPITYLCLDCMSKCICSECVVHGVHRTHDVLNIKKAYPIIFEKTQEIGKHISNKVGELSLIKQNIDKKKEDINSINNKCKNEIKIAFDELRKKINDKEKEVLIKTETTLNDSISELNTYNHIIQSKIILLNKLIDTLNAYLMRKDELTLINFYCENKNKILSQAEVNELNNLQDLTTLSNLKIKIDKNSFDTMISALNSFHFEVSKIKGIDITPKFDSPKYKAQRNLYGSNNLSNNNNILNNNNSINME